MDAIVQLRPVSMVSPPLELPIVARPDQRPAADAAALSHTPRPDVPLAIPPSNGQIGVISQSLMPTRSDDRAKGNTEEASAVQRTLKPYGISMLPQPPGENARKNTTAKDA